MVWYSIIDVHHFVGILYLNDFVALSLDDQSFQWNMPIFPYRRQCFLYEFCDVGKVTIIHRINQI
jgi:hypothetical protein